MSANVSLTPEGGQQPSSEGRSEPEVAPPALSARSLQNQNTASSGADCGGGGAGPSTWRQIHSENFALSTGLS